MNYHVDFYVSIAVTVPQSYPDKHALVFCHFIKTVPKAVNDIWCILYSCDRASWQILIIKPTRCTNFSNLFSDWNSICFGQFLCPSSGVFHCTHSNSICHTGLLTACEQDQDGTGQFHPDPARTTARGGPWPSLQYASKPLDPLLCLSIRLFPSFSGPWTRHPAISFLDFLFVLLHTIFRATSFLGLRYLAFFLYDQAIVFFGI